MATVDDPMLALIVRFVAGEREVDYRQDEFLRHQVQAVLDFIGRFPAEERQARTLEWIQENARRYRAQWQRQVVAERLADARCPDCPLVREDEASVCQIHEHWLGILDEYLADTISTAQYVEETLRLLEAHKTRLKVTDTGARLR